jgi:hypothetical protein
MQLRECPFCGKSVSALLGQCSFCREALPPVPQVKNDLGEKVGRMQIRRGLLYMLLAAAIAYLAGGYSPFKLPVRVPAILTTYLAPLLFLSGLGLAVYGYYLQRRASLT